jgi:hypothetical protein
MHFKIQREDIILLLIDQIMIIIGYVQGRIVKKKGGLRGVESIRDRTEDCVRKPTVCLFICLSRKMGNDNWPELPFLKPTLTVNTIRSEIGWQMSAKWPSKRSPVTRKPPIPTSWRRRRVET